MLAHVLAVQFFILPRTVVRHDVDALHCHQSAPEPTAAKRSSPVFGLTSLGCFARMTFFDFVPTFNTTWFVVFTTALLYTKAFVRRLHWGDHGKCMSSRFAHDGDSFWSVALDMIQIAQLVCSMTKLFTLGKSR